MRRRSITTRAHSAPDEFLEIEICKREGYGGYNRSYCNTGVYVSCGRHGADRAALDAVSSGGYFMIGTVISADMDLIGQLQPNTPTRFVRVDMPTALEARTDRMRQIDRIRAALS